MSRPAGRFGGVAVALCDAAAAGPATVRELAQRAGVGYSAARYTAARLISHGELVVLDGGRPARVAAAKQASSVASAARTEPAAEAMDALRSAFWGGSM